MRILLTTDPIGGVWTFTKELSGGLLRRGHSVALVSFGRSLSKEQAAWCRTQARLYGSAFRFESSRIPLEWMRCNHGTYQDAEPLLSRISDSFCPDIFHTSQFCFGRFPYPVPRVVTAHSDVLSWTEACRPEHATPSDWLRRYRSLVQEGLDSADTVVAPTQWMLTALGSHFDLPSATRVIPNGRTLSAATPPPVRQLQAVSVGRLWDRAKNVSLLTTVTPPMPILVAGEREHEQSAAPMQLGQTVLLGCLTETDLLTLFRSSSIYLAPSIYEPFGLAPLEAALCGCAVLANDLPSLREVWGDAALYFTDANSLVALLRHLQISPEALARAQQTAHRRALHLSASRMTEAYLHLYTELAAPALHTATAAQELVTDAG